MVRTGSRGLRRVWQVPVFLLGIGLFVVSVLVKPESSAQRQERLETLAQGAVGAIDRRALDEAYDAALELLGQQDVSGRLRSQAYFVLGSYHCLQAPDAVPVKQPAQYFRAVQYLKQARALGGGESYEGLLDLRAGLSWLRLSRPDRAIPMLKAAAALGVSSRSAVWRASRRTARRQPTRSRSP